MFVVFVCLCVCVGCVANMFVRVVCGVLCDVTQFVLRGFRLLVIHLCVCLFKDVFVFCL